MRIRIKYFYFIFLALFLPTLSFASPVTGGFTADAVLAMKPELITDTSGVRYWDVPVSRAGTTGVAKVLESRAVGALVGATRANLATLAIMGAYEGAKYAADLCWVDNTKYLTCQQKPIMPITLDTSKISPATDTPVTTTVSGWCVGGASPCPSGNFTSAEQSCIGYGRTLLWMVNDTQAMCSGGIYTYRTSSNTSTTHVYSCSSGSGLTSATGVPMPVTGQYCTPDSAYSCSTNYFRSDSSGNSSEYAMYCSYQSPVIPDVDANKMMAPFLLNYYANQLFTGSDGKPLPDVFNGPDTTFDPAVTPSSMPMTWDQLHQYVDWIRNNTAQTTDPLSPHYISPNNYDYTKTYINNNNSSVVNNTNTSSATSTITPSDAASSSAMTQSQYETSNKKADAEQATALNTALNPLTNVMTQYNADKQELINKIGSPTQPPAAMPNIFTWLWPTGQCNGFTLNLNIHVPLIGSLTMNKLFNEYCPPYRDYIHPAFFWFFNMITALYIFRLWDRTAADVAKI